MVAIAKSVGRTGHNAPADVKTVQELLNRHRPAPLRGIEVDGKIGPETISAIEEFQRRVALFHAPDGLIQPGGKTWKALNGAAAAASAPGTPAPGGSAGPLAAPTAAAAVQLSGTAWWNANQASFPNSTSVDDLEDDFRPKVTSFVAALRAAGATVSVSTTKRSKERAYLMHYSWNVGNGSVNANAVPAEPGVNIVWDHGNTAQSKYAAQEMRDLFGMAADAVLTSRHIEGKAIDMTITWTGTLKVKNDAGETVEVGAPLNGGDNTTLHAVGATYGVHKLVSVTKPDPPHWSSDGH